MHSLAGKLELLCPRLVGACQLATAPSQVMCLGLSRTETVYFVSGLILPPATYGVQEGETGPVRLNDCVRACARAGGSVREVAFVHACVVARRILSTRMNLLTRICPLLLVQLIHLLVHAACCTYV